MNNHSRNSPQPVPSTPQQLTAILKSPANQLALKAVELIKAGGPVATLREYIEQGLPFNYLERDGRSTKKYFTRMILDLCFESGFGVIKQEEVREPNSPVAMLATCLGDYLKSEGRDLYFDVLLEAGFMPGTNHWRGGELFKHIVDCCFYRENSEQGVIFTKLLLKHGRVNIQNYAARHYGWVGSMKSLKTILDLGANPQGHEMIDCALRFVGCSPNSGETESGRTDVVRELLNLGAVPTQKIHSDGSARHQRDALIKGGLMDDLARFGIVDFEFAAA